MATRKATAAIIATATCTGVGGFFFGLSFKDRDRFLVHAQLKDVLQPSSLAPPANSTAAVFDAGALREKNSMISPSSPSPSPTAVATVGPHRVSEIMAYGFPTTDYVRSRSDYVLAYDRKNRNALWVAEHLTAERLLDRTKVSRKLSAFQEDQSVHPYFRSTNEDYRASGFDRGHLAAAANHWVSQDSLDETFFLSNISPQVGVGFNRDAWNTLEKYSRDKAKSNRSVFVMTGPLYLPSLEQDGKHYVKYQVIGPNSVAVPTHFFKALLCQSATGEFHMECFVMPNKPIGSTIRVTDFYVPRDMIERAAGFLLFEGLPRSALKTMNGRKV
ncbi:Endonuclease G, mitochondrial [Hypsibius exemplaris]|uniref:Endonuclease n=1 Tax=Hypsibius exemplaris TaxID=2072580 RepID=A0A1W0XBN8_HYPEX|nr:Endonuclease G, mitochondrial [Hypsibius exemplaris]